MMRVGVPGRGTRSRAGDRHISEREERQAGCGEERRGRDSTRAFRARRGLEAFHVAEYRRGSKEQTSHQPAWYGTSAGGARSGSRPQPPGVPAGERTSAPPAPLRGRRRPACRGHGELPCGSCDPERPLAIADTDARRSSSDRTPGRGGVAIGHGQQQRWAGEPAGSGPRSARAGSREALHRPSGSGGITGRGWRYPHW